MLEQDKSVAEEKTKVDDDNIPSDGGAADISGEDLATSDAAVINKALAAAPQAVAETPAPQAVAETPAAEDSSLPDSTSATLTSESESSISISSSSSSSEDAGMKNNQDEVAATKAKFAKL